MTNYSRIRDVRTPCASAALLAVFLACSIAPGAEVTILGSNFVTNLGRPQELYLVESGNQSFQGVDRTVNLSPGTYTLRAGTNALPYIYGTFTLSEDGIVAATTGALMATENQIYLDKSRLAAVTLFMSEYTTAAGRGESATLWGIIFIFDNAAGRDETFYLPSGSYSIESGPGGLGGFTVTGDYGSMAVSQTSGALIADGNDVHIDTCNLNQVEFDMPPPTFPGDAFYSLSGANNGHGVLVSRFYSDTLLLPHGTYRLSITYLPGTTTDVVFTVNALGLTHTALPVGTSLELTGCNEDPIADAGDDVIVECTGHLTTVALSGSGSSDPDNDQLEFEWSVPAESGATLDDPTSETPIGQFPLGPTLVTLTVTDGNGGIAVDDVLVTVQDTTPPVLVCTTDQIALWPPDHTMRAVTISIAVSDNCVDPEDLLLNCTVSSSEPDDGDGDGAHTGDVDGSDGFTAPVNISGDLTYFPVTGRYVGLVLLRAERDGTANGRAYSIVCDVMDTEGNTATASCVVVVPHDKRRR